MMDRLIAAVLTTVPMVLGSAVMARADVYRAVDARGVVHLSNVPTDSRYRILIRAPRRKPTLATRGMPRWKGHKDGARIERLVAKAARSQNIDQALLRAVITAESGYDPQAVSSQGAVGLMQLMPETARRYGVTDRYDPVENIHAGARYLHDLMRRFHGDVSLVLAAYNAGEDAVAHYGNRIPPYPETRHYVPRVMDLYRRYRSKSP